MRLDVIELDGSQTVVNTGQTDVTEYLKAWSRGDLPLTEDGYWLPWHNVGRVMPHHKDKWDPKDND